MVDAIKMWRSLLILVLKRNLDSGGNLEEAIIVAKELKAYWSADEARKFLKQLGMDYQDAEEVMAQL